MTPRPVRPADMSSHQWQDRIVNHPPCREFPESLCRSEFYVCQQARCPLVVSA